MSCRFNRSRRVPSQYRNGSPRAGRKAGSKAAGSGPIATGPSHSAREAAGNELRAPGGARGAVSSTGVLPPLRRRPLLATAALLGLLAAVSCGSSAIDASLGQLVRRQQAYDGRLVITRGVLRGYDTPEHYWIEDAQGNRVELIGLTRPVSRLGSQLRVEGRFLYALDRGRRIEVIRFEEQR
jgi:hypothetical protein